jgi:hypothetical protein
VIDISIEKQNGSLFVTIEDKGVGRSEAAKYKSKNIIHYQSKGMSLNCQQNRNDEQTERRKNESIGRRS